jgi:hypothetical protein
MAGGAGGGVEAVWVLAGTSRREFSFGLLPFFEKKLFLSIFVCNFISSKNL